VLKLLLIRVLIGVDIGFDIGLTGFDRCSVVLIMVLIMVLIGADRF